MNFLRKNRDGLAALITVVVIGAATLLIAGTASYLGLSQLDFGYTSSKALEAASIADGCMDETLRRIRKDTSYGLLTSPISLSLGNGSCIISVTDLGGGQREITVESTIANYHKKFSQTITLTGHAITVNTWEELSN